MESQILEVLHRTPKTIPELSRHLGKSKHTIVITIDQLKAQKKIEQRGYDDRFTIAKSHRSVSTMSETEPKEDGEIMSTKGLRTFLVSQMEKVASGEQDAVVAKAICGYAQQIHNTISVELKHAQVSKRLDGNNIDPVRF